MDSLISRYDGNDVYCLPRGREAINTGVSIINSSLSKISYRRLTKWKSRGLYFGMPDFVAVVEGQPLTVSDTKYPIYINRT